MPTLTQAKKAWNHGRKGKEYYNAMTPEQKTAFWTYGRDNGYVDRNNLDDYKKAEYDAHVTSQYAQYAPKPTNSQIQDNLKTDRYASYTGPKVPLDYKKASYPITDTKKVIKSKPIEKKVTKETKPVEHKSQALTNLQQRTGVNGRPMPVLDQKKLDKASGTAGAFTANLVDSATLGLGTKAFNKIEPGMGDQELAKASEGHKIASLAGNMTGYVVPFAGASKIAKPLTKRITNKLLKTAATGAIEGAIVGGTEGGIKGNNVAKSAAEMAAFGAGGNIAIAGLGKVINKVLKPRVISKELPKNTTVKVQGKLSNIKDVKTRSNEINATNEYYNNIEGMDWVNMQDPAYIKAENALRKSKGLKPITESKVVVKKERVPFEPRLKPKTVTKNVKPGTLDEYYNNLNYHEYINSLDPAYIKAENALRAEKELKPIGEDVAASSQWDNKKRFLPNKDIKPIVKPKFKNTVIEQSESIPYMGNSEKNLDVKWKDIKKKNRLKPVKVNVPEEIVSSPVTTGTPNNAAEPAGTINKIVSGKQKRDLNPINWLHNLYTKTVEVAHPVNRLDAKGNYGNQSIKVMANNTKSATGQAKYILEGKLTNRAGEEIGKGYDEILRNIPKNQAKKFDDYLLHKHNVNRMAVDKSVFGFDTTAADSINRVKEYERAYPHFKQTSEELNKFMTDFSNEWGTGSGRVSKQLMAKSQEMYPNYVPVWRAGDPTFVPSEGRKGFVETTGKFLKRATGGDSEIISPTEAIRTMVEKNVKSARQNEFYNSILDEVLKNPAEMKKRGITITETGKETLDELGKLSDMKDFANFEHLKSDSKNGNVLTVMRNGEPVSLRIADSKIFKALEDIKKGYEYSGIEQAGRKIQAPFKALVTQSNPLFAVRNIFRDIPTAITNTRNNPLEYTKNLATGLKDMIKQEDLYKEYKALSGNSANLVNDGVDIIKKNPIKRAIGATETLPRYAEFKTTVKKGGGDYASRMQGLYDAMDITTNFGRYGNKTKSVDSITPYLNAGVQGLDKMVRTFVDRPIATVLKGATVVTAPVLISNHFNQSNPHYNELDNRTKDNYILIPDISSKDENGNAKSFFKVPKSREIGVLFGSLLERAMRQDAGKWKGFTGISGTIANNFAPSNPIESNILTPIVTNLASNKDFAGRTIVPQSMKDRSPKYQYDETTSAIAKKLGELTNFSPKQVDYLIKSYTGIVGQLLIPATSQDGGVKKALTNQFISNPLYSNQAITDFYDNLDMLGERAADKNFNENILSSRITKEEAYKNSFAKVQKQISEYARKATKAKTNEEAEYYRQKMIDLANMYNGKVK